MDVPFVFVGATGKVLHVVHVVLVLGRSAVAGAAREGAEAAGGLLGRAGLGVVERSGRGLFGGGLLRLRGAAAALGESAGGGAVSRDRLGGLWAARLWIRGGFGCFVRGWGRGCW